ncbi:MAG TPA: hypothetical protein DCF45_07610 [Gammaproteobacteria bacterium]|nr:hypothetical protein [Gammaproteobacteria bacterium]
MNLRKLNLNLLLVFDHIWSTRNLTQVASQLNMTQPGVSTSLNRLRELFNDPLFKWNGNTMTPTPRARQLAPRIHALLVEMDQLIGGSSNDIAETKREFVLASVDWVFADSGNGLLLRVRNQAPGIKLRFEHLSLAMFEQQERYGIDLIIAPDVGLLNTTLEKRQIYEDSFIGVAAKDNLSVGKRPSINKFATLPKIQLNTAGLAVSHHHSVNTEKAANGSSAGGDWSVQTYSYLTIPFLLQQSDCVAVVPKRLAQHLEGVTDIRTFTLPRSFGPLPIFLYWPKQFNDDLQHTWLRQQIVETAHPE